MVTKPELDNVLKEVNAILKRLDERLTKLETSQKASTTKRTTSQSKSS